MARTYVFSKQSLGPGLCDHQRFPQQVGSRIRSPLFRSYGGILPSSFTMILSIALVFSTYPPESVWGTGGSQLAHEAFLGNIGSLTHPTQSDSPSCLRHTDGGFAYRQPYTLGPGQPSPGMSYLLASLRSLPTTHLVHRLATTSPEGSVTARVLSIMRLSMDVVSPVREYQPVVHRLRLSASP